MAANHAGSGNRLVAKRDELLRKLKREGARGVRAAGITRVGGTEHLLLLVAPGYGGDLPTQFEGIPITVRETATPKA